MNTKTLAKRILVGLMLVAMMCTVLASCGKGYQSPFTYNKEGEYTYLTYTSLSPSNWNELTYQDNNDTQIMSHLGSSFFSYNFKFDDKGEIIPGDFVIEYSAATKLEDVTAKYAEAWGLNAEAKGYAYAITLREDLKWDDGTAIKAEDFIYSMKEQLNPLFQNYRADSFYVGSTIIAGAKDYAKQGQAGIFAADSAYSEYSTDLDSKLYFKLGPADETLNAECYVRSYFGFPESYDVKATAQYLIDNYGMATTADAVAAIEGKTLAEIKADETMKATWEAVLAFWQTEPNEELHLLVCEYTYPEFSWDNVGIFVGENEYEIVMILEQPLDLLKEDGTLSYKAAYNMSSLPLVHKAKYEANKVEPAEGSTLWTSTYNSSKETSASWGPYKLTFFQAGKQYILERNENWYGYNMEQYKDQYQTTRIVCDTIKEWNSAWLKFNAGEIDGIGIDVSVAPDYKGSDRAYFTPDDYVGSLQLQSSAEQLKAREEAGIDKEMLTYADFRKALSLAIDRNDYTAKCTTASLKGLGLYNSMHYYDVANGGVYRETDVAKQVLCDVYGVDASKYESLDAAVDAITGYDLDQARTLLTKAYNDAIAAGTISETDKVKLVFGTGAINESVQRHFDYLSAAWKKMAEGTPLEGRLEFELQDFSTAWSNDFRAGRYDICMGGFTGAAWDPGYFLLAYLGPDYMYSKAWDTSAHMMTFTMKGVGENGADITETMSLMDWYDCLNGASGAKYNWSSAALEENLRLPLIAALEKEVLTAYYTVPTYNNFSASLISYKVDYITYEYNTFMSYGGVRYMTYNYDDAQWEAQVVAQKGVLNYK